jgi:hypothetical protein
MVSKIPLQPISSQQDGSNWTGQRHRGAEQNWVSGQPAWLGILFQRCRLISGYLVIQSAFFFEYVYLVGRIGVNHHFWSIFVGVQAGYF